VDVDAMRGFIEFFQENGPTPLARHVIGNKGLQMGLHNAFGIEGHLVIMTGMGVPYKARHMPAAEEWQRWQKHKADLSAEASRGLSVEEALMYIRHPGWRWNVELMNQQK